MAVGHLGCDAAVFRDNARFHMLEGERGGFYICVYVCLEVCRWACVGQREMQGNLMALAHVCFLC